MGIEVDARADVFSLGIITWEMLSGYRLFVGDTPLDTVNLVKAARVPSLVALNPNVHPELEAIVRQALARDRDERFQSAADYADALSHFLFSHEMKITSRAVSSAVRAAKVARERAKDPNQTLIQALIADEVNKMTSLVEEELRAHPTDAVDHKPGEMVDTKDWAKDLLDE
jgi:eukaryotic-like serine/threonine-protein kinase